MLWVLPPHTPRLLGVGTRLRTEDAVIAMHGWGIGERIAQLSRDVFRLQTGTLYPALHRLVRKGWITAEWRTTENGRRARYYRLTASGRKQLDAERASWSRASLAVNRILTAES